ncbi:MAG TPA: hypothetical protein VK158_03555 [Acidobacteriota bacterium]|nr:hypothetical protein [Acidobacteriota bacterium]
MRHQWHLLTKMKELGWHPNDIAYARYVLTQAPQTKTPWQRFLDASILWIFLIIIGFGNMCVLALSVPLIVIFPNPALYGMLIILGISFGLLCESVIRDIQHFFSGHHQVIVYVLMPYFAAVCGYVLFSKAIQYLPNFFLFDRHPLTMSIIYAVSFLAPLLASYILHIHWKTQVKEFFAKLHGSHVGDDKKEPL